MGFSGFCPSFRYFSTEMKSIISHTLSVEIPFLSNKNNINIFIKKPPEKEKEEKNKNNKDELDKAVFGDELIKRLFKNVGRLSYYIKIKKSIPYKGKLPIEINIDSSQLGGIIIKSIVFKIKKIINLFDDNGLKNGELCENVVDAKKIIIKGNKINTIKESIQMPKTEFVPLSSKSIHKPKLSGEISNYTPPMKNSLIICQYYLIVNFILEDNLMKNKTVKISFDLYDDEYNLNANNRNKNKNEEENNIIYINNEEIGSINDNYNDDNPNDDIFKEIEKENNKKINNDKKDIKNIKEYNGFVVFDNDDFMKSFNLKNKE